MAFVKLPIVGAFIVENSPMRDSRGLFLKTYNRDEFHKIGFQDSFAESYYSQSIKGVIRGMHFQLPPFEHEKLIYVTEGEITDVVLDLRTQSPTFRSYCSVGLRAFERSVFIPKGCAHGFLTVSPRATVIYNVTSVHRPEYDSGIRWDSFGFAWGEVNPILSERDQSFMPLNQFTATF